MAVRAAWLGLVAGLLSGAAGAGTRLELIVRTAGGGVPEQLTLDCLWSAWGATAPDQHIVAAADGTTPLDLESCLGGLDWAQTGRTEGHLYLLVRAAGQQALRSDGIRVTSAGTLTIAFPRHPPFQLRRDQTARARLTLEPATTRTLLFHDQSGLPLAGVMLDVLLERPAPNHCNAVDRSFVLASGRTDARGALQVPAVESPLMLVLADPDHVFIPDGTDAGAEVDAAREPPERVVLPEQWSQPIRVRRFAIAARHVLAVTQSGQAAAAGLRLVGELRTWHCGMGTGVIGSTGVDGRIVLQDFAPEA